MNITETEQWLDLSEIYGGEKVANAHGWLRANNPSIDPDEEMKRVTAILGATWDIPLDVTVFARFTQ